MDRFRATHIQFTLSPVTAIQFGAQPGSQIRGALYNALKTYGAWASENRRPESNPLDILFPHNPSAARGQTPPPPFSIKPPPGDTYLPGETTGFGFTLFGEQQALFPYLVHGVRDMGQIGVGRGRGQYVIEHITAINPITGQQEELLQDGQVKQPSLHITHEDIQSSANKLPADQLSLDFLTPTRLNHKGKPCSHPQFDVLFARLLERLDMLLDEYAPGTGKTPYIELNTLAGGIKKTADDTDWISIRSGSSRHGYATAIGGFVGRATFVGDLAPFQYWLLWGEIVQIGKNTAKGDGWYRVVR